jgi:hypothetical protein
MWLGSTLYALDDARLQPLMMTRRHGRHHAAEEHSVCERRLEATVVAVVVVAVMVVVVVHLVQGVGVGLMPHGVAL